ncbi:probable salivary secreted peptide [Phymastichus coffea]|uniref:probable salivary secreted peptide n=1 Tax=Phymastichus coffea TaxID=108790 RepID=UPI00273BCDFE|nr:probable salivary secreted peptide [Phymastichus coffea]
MSSSRFLISIVLLASLLAIALAAMRSRSIIIGARLKGDHLIQRETLKVPSKLLRVVKDRRTYSGDKRSRITQVRLLDQNKKGSGAVATVAAGGPGQKYVTVDFKSVSGHSIDYIIELYGRQ